MILALTDNTTQSFNMILSAAMLATKLGKKFTICIHKADNDQTEKTREILNEITVKPKKIIVVTSNSESFSDICEQHEALFLFIQLKKRKRSEIQNILNNCRQLRIPYILFSNDYQPINLNKIIVPVSFLEEEFEKAQFASAFGRFCNAHIILLQAADYGSKAAITTSKMTELFSKFNFSWETKHARKGSFKVDSEALTLAEQTNAGLIIVSASRDYGLDDIIFGPKEMHLIKKAGIPVMLVNPRGDLYTLCD
jgi:hypothetical protein